MKIKKKKEKVFNITQYPWTDIKFIRKTTTRAALDLIVADFLQLLWMFFGTPNFLFYLFIVYSPFLLLTIWGIRFFLLRKAKSFQKCDNIKKTAVRRCVVL